METIIVYLDDASHAQQQLAPMKRQPGATHWVLVGCAPRMTRRVSQWVSRGARQKWRAQWAARLFAAVRPSLDGGGDRVTTLLAQGPLVQLTSQLITEHSACRVLDARRPKFGDDLEPVMAGRPAVQHAHGEVPGAVAGLGAAPVLAAE